MSQYKWHFQSLISTWKFPKSRVGVDLLENQEDWNAGGRQFDQFFEKLLLILQRGKRDRQDAQDHMQLECCCICII